MQTSGAAKGVEEHAWVGDTPASEPKPERDPKPEPARPAVVMASPHLSDSVLRPSSATSQDAIALRALPPGLPERDSGGVGRKTPPDLKEMSQSVSLQRRKQHVDQKTPPNLKRLSPRATADGGGGIDDGFA